MRFIPLLLIPIAAPAQAMDIARSIAQVPEPSNLGLFALGLAGVLIGRRAAMRKNRDEDR